MTDGPSGSGSEPSGTAKRLSLQCPRAESSCVCSAWSCVLRWPAVARGQTALSGTGDSHHPRDRHDHDRRRPVGRRLAHGNADRNVVRGQSRRQRRAEGQERRVSDLRRSVLLCRLRVRGSEPGGDARAVSPIATTSATGSTTTAASSSTPRNTGRTATFFVVTPRNIQYDAITDDASGEDSSPDFFWESATKHHRARLDARNPHPVLVASLQECRSADLGHPAVPQLSRAIGTTSSFRRSCRAAATASSAMRIRWSVSSGCRRAGISSPRPT